MSATIDTSVYISYFSRNGKRPKEITVEGRCFDVDVKYLDQIENEVKSAKKFLDTFEPSADAPSFSHVQIKICVEILKHLDKQEQGDSQKGSVLIFLPGLQEINKLHRAINVYAKREQIEYLLKRIHSMLPRDRADMKQLMNRPENGSRKVIISTNICESSITIPDIRYVIDFCMTKYQRKCESTNLVKLAMNWASEESCDQRKGRAGRTQPGTCYRLLTKQFFLHSLSKSTPPEIEHAQLEKAILVGKVVFPNRDPRSFLNDACAVPKDADVNLAIKSLKQLGALSVRKLNSTMEDVDKDSSNPTNEKMRILSDGDLADGEVTPMGKLMSIMPMNFAQSRLIYYGYIFGFINEAVVIAAGMQQQGFWLEDSAVQTGDTNVTSFRHRMYWSRGTQSDHIAILNAFMAWYSKMPEDYKVDGHFKRRIRRTRFLKKDRNQPIHTREQKEIEWCKSHGINHKAMRETHIMVDDILRRLVDLGYYAGDKGHVEDLRLDLKKACSVKGVDYYYDMLKIVIGAACYPHYYNVNDVVSEEMKAEEFHYFNPRTTVLFKTPDERSYAVGKDLWRILSACGTVNRMYFVKEKILVEFESEGDLDLFARYGFNLRYYAEFNQYQANKNGSDVSPAVLCALSAGQSRHRESRSLDVYCSGDFQPNANEPEGQLYHINCQSVKYKTRFPHDRKLHPKKYDVEITHPEDAITFWGVEPSDNELRVAIEEHLAEGYVRLEAFKGPIPTNSLVVAPYEAQLEKTSYHRALVICSSVWHKKSSDYCLVRFIDYGNDAVVEQATLRAIPAVSIPVINKEIQDIEFLAVKYRLQGVEVNPCPNRYAYTCWNQGDRIEVDIFSTADGAVVKVDAYQQRDGRPIDFRQKQVANGYATEVKESYIHKISNDKWRGKYSPTDPDRQSGNDTPLADSGHVSDSSHDATVNLKWVDLKDTSSDSGMFSPTSELKEQGDLVTLRGPFNSFNCSIQSNGM